MPRENIYGTDGIHVMVVWDKNDPRLAQIATFNKDATKVLKPEPDNGWFVDLTEENIDRLIKVLKRARRKMFR